LYTNHAQLGELQHIPIMPEMDRNVLVKQGNARDCSKKREFGDIWVPWFGYSFRYPQAIPSIKLRWDDDLKSVDDRRIS
jgi:hypothetical protein